MSKKIPDSDGLKEKEIIKRFKEKISMAPAPDFSNEERYRDFSERLCKKTVSKMEGLDRLQKRSLAKAHTKMFG